MNHAVSSWLGALIPGFKPGAINTTRNHWRRSQPPLVPPTLVGLVPEARPLTVMEHVKVLFSILTPLGVAAAPASNNISHSRMGNLDRGGIVIKIIRIRTV